jgi:cell division protein FtsI (penicillin-binding protein 3)
LRSRNRFSSRLHFLSVVIALGATAVLSKMAHLTLVEGEEYRNKGWSEKCDDVTQMAYRGGIVDRNGVALATTVASSRVTRERGYTYDPAHAEAMAPMLGIEPAKLDATLSDGGDRFLWLSKGVDLDTTQAIDQLDIRGIGIHKSQSRGYPQGTVAANIIGFTGSDSQGLEGIERQFDSLIAGEPVKVHVCKDVRGQVFLSRGDMAGVNRGSTVHLTLDATLQTIAETELARQIEKSSAAGGTVVMMEPHTGDILAMASFPTYDPNHYSDYPVSWRRNRAVTDLYEPGSTMKPFVVAAALEAGLIRASDEIFCENGAFRMDKWPKPIRDHHGYGMLSIQRIIQVSSNICTAKIGFKLGPQRLYDFLVDFGFDRKSGIALPGEAPGLVPDPEEWRSIRTATVSFGQGISVNALQMASAFATLANDGVRMKPRIVRKITDQHGALREAFEPEEDRRVVATEVARTVSAMLETVTQRGGTATGAAIEGIPVAGKTGTAQKVGARGYDPNKWVASFAGYFPADDPRVVISVMVDEPQGQHYGGLIAAPVFKAVAEASLDYLGIERRLPPVEVAAATPSRSGATRQPAAAPQAPPAASAPTQAADAADCIASPNLCPGDGDAEVSAGFARVMPELTGLGLRSVLQALEGCDCDIRIAGSGYVIGQQPAAGEPLEPEATISVSLGRRL